MFYCEEHRPQQLTYEHQKFYFAHHAPVQEERFGVDERDASRGSCFLVVCWSVYVETENILHFNRSLEDSSCFWIGGG